MTIDRPIRFRFSARKALAAVHWMLQQSPSLDLHTVLKSCYFGDREHLNRHERPIFGATYRAMRYGPVPLEIYELTKSEPMWLAELGIDQVPWDLNGHKLSLHSNIDPDLGSLSETDRDTLSGAFERSRGMTFDERTLATHGPDWRAAHLGIMRYEDMIDEGPRKAALIEELRELAPVMRL